MRVREATFPYPLPPTESVKAGPWLTADGVPLPDRLLDWDPATEVHIFRRVQVDAADVLASCELDPRARLILIPRVRSDRTGLRIVGTTCAVEPRNGTEAEIAAHIRGDALGGTLIISTGLLWVAGSATGPLAPQMPGSQLWSDEVRCALEGLAARFPISPVTFSTLPTLDPDAGWTLDWEPTQLEDPVLGAVRLLINTEHPRIRESVVSGSREPGADVVRALIQFDVARTLIISALENPEFAERADAYPDESVGRTIADLIRTHWSESPTALAARLSSYPRRFEMELQARFRPVPIS